MKTAFFLGAGASKTFGCPLTGEILPLILQRLLDQKLFGTGAGQGDPHRIDRERFRTLLDRLVPGWRQSYEQANPEPAAGRIPAPIGVGITDVLTLVDYTIQTAAGKGSEGPSGLAAFRELLER
jgi:hypothetical protein